jgi:hypothetical protein
VLKKTAQLRLRANYDRIDLVIPYKTTKLLKIVWRVDSGIDKTLITVRKSRVILVDIRSQQCLADALLPRNSRQREGNIATTPCNKHCVE